MEVPCTDRTITLFDRWLQEARAGSSKALARALEWCYRLLKETGRFSLGPSLRAKIDDADVLQDALMYAQKNLQACHATNGETFESWLTRVICNQLTDVVRRYHRSKRDTVREVSFDDQCQHRAFSEKLASDASSPVRAAMRHEEDEAINGAVNELPPDCRQVVRLFYFEERALKEIGRVIGCEVNAARVVRDRALRELRRRLTASDYRA